MKTLALYFVIAALTGCSTSTPPAAEQPLTRAEETSASETTIETRFDRSLIAGPRALPEGATDAIPPRAFWIEANGRRHPAPLAIDGWLTASGGVFVTLAQELVDEQGTVIATDVEPSVSVSAEGDHVAFQQENGRGLSRVMVWAIGSDQPPRPATDTLDDAVMPFYLRDGSLVLTGAHAGELLGLFHVDLQSGRARRLTNEGLLLGSTQDPRFVPLPLGPRSMHELDGRIVYFDGEDEQTLSLEALEGSRTP